MAGGEVGEADGGFDADGLQRLDADDAGPRVVAFMNEPSRRSSFGTW